MSVERTFCLKCNRPVGPGEVCKDYIFIENKGDIIRIDHLLTHRVCGGKLRPMPLY